LAVSEFGKGALHDFACCHWVNMMSSNSLPPWQPTGAGSGGIIARMATIPRIGQRRRARLYIDEWFEFRGLNDEKVGQRLELDRTTIWKWRKNPSRLDPGKMEALAAALECDVVDLYRPPARVSLDAIARDYPEDLQEKAAEIVRLLGRTG
jgi:hypothetical protein